MRRALAILAVAAVPAAAAQSGSDIWLADLVWRDSVPLLANVTRVTSRAGYDNQPWFTPDGRALLYTSYRDGQADTWRHDLATGVQTPLTRTPTSEYSPRMGPDGGIAVVMVEADSTQRLWRVPAQGGSPRLLLPDVRGIGYYDVLGEGYVVFRLGNPNTLEYVGPGQRDTIARDVGPTIQAVPEGGFVLFVARQDSLSVLRVWSPATGLADRRVPLPGGPYFAASEHGLFAPDGRGIAWYAPRPGAGWRPMEGLDPGRLGITRLAVSPDGRRIVFVAADGS